MMFHNVMFENKILKPYDKRVKFLKHKDKTLAKFIETKGDIEYYLCSEPIKFVIFEIIGQLISIKVATKIFDRFIELCDNDFSPIKLVKIKLEDMRKIGLSWKKATYINQFVQHLIDNPCFLNDLTKMNDENAMKALITLHGIGPWTAKMYLIFVLDRENIFPFEDLALIKGLEHLYKRKFKNKKELEKFSVKWHPYKSIASRYIYEFADELFSNKPNIAI